MKKRILITFGTRALGQRVAKLLQAKFDVFFASADEIPNVLLSSGKYIKIPAGLSPTYAHELLKISLDNQIDYILPLGSFEFEPLSESKILFEEYDIQLFVPNKDVLENYMLIENPSKDLPILLILNGEVLLGDLAIHTDSRDGLFVVSDAGEDLALCAVSKD